MIEIEMRQVQIGDKISLDPLASDDKWTRVVKLEKGCDKNHIHINGSVCWDARQPVYAVRKD